MCLDGRQYFFAKRSYILALRSPPPQARYKAIPLFFLDINIEASITASTIFSHAA
jgi:hypothetical protein